MFTKIKKNKPLYRQLRLAVIVVACLLLGLGVFFTWNQFLRDTSVSLKISAGRTVSRRHELVEQLSEATAGSGIHLNVVSTAGSEEALRLVESGALDVAVISTGMTSSTKDHVRELASFHVEPAHFLIRKELAEKPGLIRDIIRGKRVNMGEPGSTAYLLAKELLSFAHMQPGTESTPGDFQALTMGDDELIKLVNDIQQSTGDERRQKIDAMPDAVLLVSSLPSLVAQRLIEVADYRLVSLPFARAFIMHGGRDGTARKSLIDHSYIEQVAIPAGTYLGSVPVPQKDSEAVGLRLLMVANKDVPAGVIYRLMSKVFEGEFARKNKPVSAVAQSSPYPVHLGALAFENRNKPYILNEFMEMGKKAISVFGLFSAGALSLLAVLRTRSSKSPGDYLMDIRQIELIARGIIVDKDAPRDATALAKILDQRLAKLKSELIDACCKKQFKNEMMLLNILTILVDTRQQVAEMLQRPGESSEPASTVEFKKAG
jgi:TRAP-type uncharacterized transport system substrate-binding protein